jgi:hypothetical protein
VQIIQYKVFPLIIQQNSSYFYGCFKTVLLKHINTIRIIKIISFHHRIRSTILLFHIQTITEKIKK